MNYEESMSNEFTPLQEKIKIATEKFGGRSLKIGGKMHRPLNSPPNWLGGSFLCCK
jgi:uncharacterized protein (DUF1330 family)